MYANLFYLVIMDMGPGLLCIVVCNEFEYRGFESLTVSCTSE